MKAVVLTSNSLRHKYFSKVMNDHFNLVGIISEPKEFTYEQVKQDSKTIRKHFANLKKYEQEAFDNVIFPENVDILNLQKSRINDADVIEWAILKNPDVILLFGTAILKSEWLKIFENKIINLHLGLSPYYRGSATLFWPFFYDEIECVGATIHLASEKVDAGDIIGRVKPDLIVGDNYYSINIKTIKKAIDLMPQYIFSFLKCEISPIRQNHIAGRLCKRKDFNEQALIKALDSIGEGLTEEKMEMIKESTECNY